MFKKRQYRTFFSPKRTQKNILIHLNKLNIPYEKSIIIKKRLLNISFKSVVHGNWGSWINSSDCSVSCGGGSRTRTRYCNDPSPDVYGLDCIGSNTSQIICNTDVCPSKIKETIYIQLITTCYFRLTCSVI